MNAEELKISREHVNTLLKTANPDAAQIGRASCRERV